MDLIKMAREMGKEIQKTEEYKKYTQAKEKNDADKDLEKLIGDFNLKRMELNNLMGRDDADKDQVTKLDNELKEQYEIIMKNQNMIDFNEAKTSFDAVLKQVNTIIMMSANGDDPDTIDPAPSCGPEGCSGCSGCS